MPLQRDVVRVFAELYGREETSRILVDYYGKSVQGQNEKRCAQHEHKDVQDFVNEILDDVLGVS